MDYLDSVFNLWLLMLQNVVNDAIFGSMFWVFILVMSILILHKIWRGVLSWST